MKELLKSKAMIGFVIFIFSILYINSVSIKNEMKTEQKSENIKLVYNK